MSSRTTLGRPEWGRVSAYTPRLAGVTAFTSSTGTTLGIGVTSASNFPLLTPGATTRCGRCRYVLGSPGEARDLVVCACPGHRARDLGGYGYGWWFGRSGR